ncbi:hypothetical protein NL676_003023 [Syzygium grande]|nr:hypothetical protein NL676_003023 [Syzygium grande]
MRRQSFISSQSWGYWLNLNWVNDPGPVAPANFHPATQWYTKRKPLSVTMEETVPPGCVAKAVPLWTVDRLQHFQEIFRACFKASPERARPNFLALAPVKLDRIKWVTWTLLVVDIEDFPAQVEAKGEKTGNGGLLETSTGRVRVYEWIRRDEGSHLLEVARSLWLIHKTLTPCAANPHNRHQFILDRSYDAGLPTIIMAPIRLYSLRRDAADEPNSGIVSNLK